nr:LrgB family protein [uncultured Sphaerochaeta sp.]
MREFLTSPVFAVFLSLLTFQAGVLVREKSGLSFLNPLLVALLLTIPALIVLDIPYETYNRGGSIITFFLAPATIALALPLYRMFHLFRKNALPILIGILFGSASGIISVILLARLFGLSEELTVSLIPKSITTPIGMALSEQLGGITPITVMAIVITGLSGSVIGPVLHRISRLNDPVAMGIAMGCSSHAVGTAKAMELGETEGAMSGLTIALAGIITVFLAPPIWQLFS